MVLSLFFSVTSALVSTLIQQWAREYLQYTQPSAAPHKRGRMRAYLFDGLIRSQMKRLTYGVPVLLHLSVFLFFYALSEWLYSINVPVGATARYSLVALLTVYMALSVLPLIVRNSPYQTALTTPLQACVSLIQVSYIGLRQLVRRSSRVYESQKRSWLYRSVHGDRARALMKDIKMKAPELDRSAMHWLLQELDEDDMDTFLIGLPGYIDSPLTNKKLAVESLLEDGVPGRIREHITTCLRSVGLSQEESMSRASVCINSLRLISETASSAAVGQPGLENADLRAIMEYLEQLCFNPSTALRPSCIRGLVIREFLISVADLDAEELKTKRFPDHLMPLYRVIREWKTTEVTQWSDLTGILTATNSLPSDQEMWADVVYDGPLINLAALSYAVLSRASEWDVDFDMALRTIEILLKSLGLAQFRASPQARDRFKGVLLKARAGNSGYGGRAQITPLVKTLEIVISGLHLSQAFVHSPKPMLSPRQIEAIFGPDQIRDSELLEAFAAHLPEFVNASTPEALKTFMEHLILEDKLWEQLHSSTLWCFDPQLPIPDKLRIITAVFDIFDVAFEVLQVSSIIDWRSPDLFQLSQKLREVETDIAPGNFFGKAVRLRSVMFGFQICHALLGQFSLQRSRGEPFKFHFLDSFRTMVVYLGVGTKEDAANLTYGPSSESRTGLDLVNKADAILNVALHDGPLSYFCMLGRWIYEEMASEVTPDDAKKMWKMLDRTLETPQLPLANASRGKWVIFDHLRASVRDHVLVGGSGQTVEKLRPLLDAIEKVERMRPPADRRDERMGSAESQVHADGSLSHDAWLPDMMPIPGSSREVEGSRSAPRDFRDQRLFHPVPGTTPTTGQFKPRDWTPPGQPNLVTNEPSTSSIPIPSTYPPHAPQVHLQSFASPHVADPTNLQAQGYTQPMPMDNPVLPWHILSNPYPSPFPSSGPIGLPPLGDAEQHSTQDSTIDAGPPVL